MKISSQRKRIETTAEIIRRNVSPSDDANYEAAKYYVGAIISITNEMNIMVGNVISRATLDPGNYRLSSSKYKDKQGRIKELSEVKLGAKLDMLDSIAKDMGVPNTAKNKISNLRNLPAHAVIVMNEEDKALLWDKYDINAAFDNDVEKCMYEFLDEAEELKEFCKKIIEKMDAVSNVK